MTRAEAITKLQECIAELDFEKAHEKADGVLCRLLIQLGYSDVVDLWADVTKWYS